MFSGETLTGTDKRPERSLCCTRFPAEDGLPWKYVIPMSEHKTALSKDVYLNHSVRLHRTCFIFFGHFACFTLVGD